MSIRSVRVAVMVFAALLVCERSEAQVDSLLVLDGVWNDAGNWSPAEVPNNGGSLYNVTILGIPGQSTITSLETSSITINLLTLVGDTGTPANWVSLPAKH